MKIDKTHGKNLHKLFTQQNKSHMLTHHGKPLKGFYIEREHLEEILADKRFTGIHFYLAKHHEHQNTHDNVFTLVYTGARPNPDYDAVGANGKDGIRHAPYLNDGEMYDDTKTCPDHCGDVNSGQ